MNENRRQILEMLAAGKITAEEAERLLAALDPEPVSLGGMDSNAKSGNGTKSCDEGPLRSTCGCWLKPMSR